jgi:pyruvate dehydrogenase E2 component (dihydrolipoamide acetyltransferase)
MLLKLISIGLGKHPYLNASWSKDGIVLYPNIEIAVAVATETGLITPVVRSCQNKGILQINSELNELITKARQGSLSPEEYKGHTFTFTNLGMYDIEDFSAIINLPDAAVIAVGTVRETPVGINGEIFLKPMMNITLSTDHRVIDGAVGAEFLQELKVLIESPMLGFFS